MPIKIRLQRQGAKRKPFYFIVVANSRAPRDGKFIEKLGTYNPLTVPATIKVNRERALHWLHKGAETTHTSRRILSFKGVLYLKHLMRGVKLGLFDEQAVMEKFEKWNSEHEHLVVTRKETHKKHKADSRIKPILKKVDDAMEPTNVSGMDVENTASETATDASAEHIESAQ